MADISTKNIAWLAGLLEGEGCFINCLRKNPSSKTTKRIGIQLIMTDLDPVVKAANIMGTSYCLSTQVTTGGKSIYRTNAYGKKAAEWMMTLYTLMGIRRKKKIEECLLTWRSMQGRGSRNQYGLKGEPNHRG